jgi:hypothetical protein
MYRCLVHCTPREGLYVIEVGEGGFERDVANKGRPDIMRPLGVMSQEERYLQHLEYLSAAHCAIG